MSRSAPEHRDIKYQLARPHGLSPRSKWLRDYYFLGVNREWCNIFTPYSTGLKGDRQWTESDYYIVPESYFYMGNKDWGVYGRSVNLAAEKVELPEGFWNLSLPERRMVFLEKVMLDYMPQEIIGPELLAGGRFNTQLSKCLNEKEQKEFDKQCLDMRRKTFAYNNWGFGNVGATAGHLIPDYETIVKKGFKYIYEKAKSYYEKLKDKKSPEAAELRAIMLATKIPQKLALKYAEECKRVKEDTSDPDRQQELEQMIENLQKVPWEPAETFWQGVQAVWLTH
ncbi:MAG: pyruvate formate lyase family protein, partial [Candidatus Hodarchaeales archaeon]